MRPLLFGRKDPRRLRVPLLPRTREDDAPYDTANSTALLTPEFDKGNDDVTAIRSSLGLDTDKRHPHAE